MAETSIAECPNPTEYFSIMVSMSDLTLIAPEPFRCNTASMTLLASWRMEGLENTIFWSIRSADSWTLQSEDDFREATMRFLRNVAEILTACYEQSTTTNLK